MTDFLPTVNVGNMNVPRLDEYFGLWAMEPSRGMAMLRRAASMNLVEHVSQTPQPHPHEAIGVALTEPLKKPEDDSEDDSEDDEEPLADAEMPHIRVIHLSGTLMKQQSSMDESTSTVVARKQVREATSDPSCMGIMLVCDSPGGSVSGAFDLADEVRSAAAAKPCVAFVEDLCASACYLIASQCEEVYCNHPTAMVGSIGTLIATYDESEAATKAGIQAKIYATGPLKGAGFPGAKITKEQDEYFQKIVDDTQVHFAAYVCAGRDMTAKEVEKCATGGVFSATEGAAMKLCDGIKTYEQTIARISEMVQQKITAAGSLPTAISQRKDAHMSKETPAAVAPAPDGKAFLAAFGPQGAVWHVEGKTFEEATALYNESQAKCIAGLEDQIKTLNTENAELKARIVGLRGASVPVSADAADADPVNAKVVDGLDAKIGKNLAAVARSIQLPKAAR